LDVKDFVTVIFASSCRLPRARLSQETVRFFKKNAETVRFFKKRKIRAVFLKRRNRAFS
jgi:hypothetical protein